MNIYKQIKDLEVLLPKLAASEIACIEYGDPTTVGGYLTHLRIYWIPTPAGHQFAVKFVRSNVEGSGVYFSDAESCASYVTKQLVHYHRPITNPKMREFLDKHPRPALSFFVPDANGLTESRRRAAGLVAYRMDA